MKSDFWHIWTIPLWLGMVSLFGLIAALVGDNIWDILSWVSLTIPLVVISRFVIKPRSEKRQKSSR